MKGKLIVLLVLTFMLLESTDLYAQSICPSNAGCSGSQCDETTETFCTGGQFPFCATVVTSSQCLSCDAGKFRPDGSTCHYCANGQDYNVGQGYYRTGTQCSGLLEVDTQTRAECSGGQVYTCPEDLIKNGTVCDGFGFSDTQTCVTKELFSDGFEINSQ